MPCYCGLFLFLVNEVWSLISIKLAYWSFVYVSFVNSWYLMSKLQIVFPTLPLVCGGFMTSSVVALADGIMFIISVALTVSDLILFLKKLSYLLLETP